MTTEQTIIELNEARRLWGQRSTATPENILRIIKGLGLVLFRCPKEMVTMVEAHIIEAEKRLVYSEFYPKETK